MAVLLSSIFDVWKVNVKRSQVEKRSGNSNSSVTGYINRDRRALWYVHTNRDKDGDWYWDKDQKNGYSTLISLQDENLHATLQKQFLSGSICLCQCEHTLEIWASDM